MSTRIGRLVLFSMAVPCAAQAYVRHSEPIDPTACFLFFCDYDWVRSSTAGLAGQVDLVWAPFSAFGLGLTGLGNVNSLRSFAALTFSVHVGRVR
jgi:hypothetical protein